MEGVDSHSEEQITDHVESKGKRKKRRIPAFLETWLESQQPEPNTKTEDQLKKEQETPETSKSESVLNWLRRTLRRTAVVETVSATAETPSSDDHETTEIPTQELGYNLLYERADTEPEVQVEPAETVEKSTMQTQTASSLVAEQDFHDVPEVAAIQRKANTTNDALEVRGQSEARVESQGEQTAPTVITPETRSSESNETYYRRRQERQLSRIRRRARRLKRQVKSLQKSRRHSAKEQVDTNKHLEAHEDAIEQFQKVTLPRLERSRRELRQRIEVPPSLSIQAAEHVTLQPKTELAIKTEWPVTQLNEVKQVVEASPATTKPEVILHNVESVAEHNLPIENILERRHEIKDEPSSVQATGVASLSSRGGLSSASSASPSHPSEPRLPSPQTVRQTVLGTPEYRQAVKNGFWAAIGIIIGFVVIILVAHK